MNLNLSRPKHELEPPRVARVEPRLTETHFSFAFAFDSPSRVHEGNSNVYSTIPALLYNVLLVVVVVIVLLVVVAVAVPVAVRGFCVCQRRHSL